MPAPRLDHQLCYRLYAASRLVQRAYKPLLAQIGLTYPQYLVFLVLWECHDQGQPWPSISEIGARLRLDSGTLTPLLKRMESHGLITRQRSDDDERVVRIAATEAGLALATDAEKVPAQVLCKYEGRYDGDVGRLIDLMGQLDDLLETLEATPP